MFELGPPLTVTVAPATARLLASTTCTVSAGIVPAVPPSTSVNALVRSVGYAFGTSWVVAVEYVPFEASTRAVYWTFGTTGSPAIEVSVSEPPVKAYDWVPRDE